MIVITGPSASGKTSISKTLIKKYGFEKVVTYTTRSPRAGEVNGIDYHFVTNGEFVSLDAQNNFVESIYYNGNYYGTAFEDVEGKKVLIVDIKGANTFYEKIGDKAIFFYIHTDKEVIKSRMKERGDSAEKIKSRIEEDKNYFNERKMKHIDFVIDTSVIGLNDITEDIYNKYIEKIGDKNGSK